MGRENGPIAGCCLFDPFWLFSSDPDFYNNL